MTRITTFLFLLITVAFYTSNAQNVTFSQNFDGLNPFKGFVLENVDRATPSDTNWKTLADSAWIARKTDASTNKAAISTSAYSSTKASNDWLITPAIRLGKASKLHFAYKSLTASKNDKLEVYISTTEQTAGGCIFNPKLQEYTSNQTAAFQTESIDLAAAGYANQYVFIGFRNSTSNGDKLALDDLVVTEDSTQFVTLTFTVNMSNYISAGKFKPRADTVDVAGSFNDWDGTRNILSIVPGSDSSIYSTTIAGFMDGDNLQFKFRINSTWHDSIVEFPYGLPNRIWNVEPGKYTYLCFYNNQGTTFNTPDNELMSQVKVFPNPASEWLKIEYPQAINHAVLLNLSGQKLRDIKTSNSESTLLDVSDLPSSTYILLFYSGTNYAGSRKVIKQ